MREKGTKIKRKREWEGRTEWDLTNVNRGLKTG
jgi:hypothetical protein